MSADNWSSFSVTEDAFVFTCVPPPVWLEFMCHHVTWVHLHLYLADHLWSHHPSRMLILGLNRVYCTDGKIVCVLPSIYGRGLTVTPVSPWESAWSNRANREHADIVNSNLTNWRIWKAATRASTFRLLWGVHLSLCKKKKKKNKYWNPETQDGSSRHWGNAKMAAEGAWESRQLSHQHKSCLAAECALRQD